MTLHKLVIGATWEVRDPRVFETTITYTGGYRGEEDTGVIRQGGALNNEQELRRTIRRRLAEYGWYSPEPYITLSNTLLTETARLILPKHIYFHTAHTVSHRPDEGFKPLALPVNIPENTFSSQTLPPYRDCQCGLCLYYEQRLFAGGEGPEPDEPGAFEGWQVDEEEESEDDAWEPENDEDMEGIQRCPGCLEPSPYSINGIYDTYTNANTGEVWHLRCAMQAAEDT